MVVFTDAIKTLACVTLTLSFLIVAICAEQPAGLDGMKKMRLFNPDGTEYLVPEPKVEVGESEEPSPEWTEKWNLFQDHLKNDPELAKQYQIETLVKDFLDKNPNTVQPDINYDPFEVLVNLIKNGKVFSIFFFSFLQFLTQTNQFFHSF